MDKKNTTVIIVSFLILLLSAGVVYMLVLPAYKDVGVADSQLVQLKSQVDMKKNYYATIDSQFSALENAGWAEKRKSIEVNFTSSPFFMAKTNAFFKTIVEGSGMVLSNATSSSASPAKGAVQKASVETDVKISKGGGSEAATAQPQRSGSYFDQLQGDVNKIAFNISVTGTYNSFKKLLSDLESQTRIVTVKSIAVSSSQQGSGKGNISMFNLVVDVYSY